MGFNLVRLRIGLNPEILKVKDKNGLNLLHTFVYYNTKHDFVWLLMANGLDPDEVNNDGLSARDYARNLGRVRLYKAINMMNEEVPEEKDAVLRGIYEEMDQLHRQVDKGEIKERTFYEKLNECCDRIVEHKKKRSE